MLTATCTREGDRGNIVRDRLSFQWNEDAKIYSINTATARESHLPSRLTTLLKLYPKGGAFMHSGNNRDRSQVRPRFNFSASEFAVLGNTYDRAVAECRRVGGFVPYEHGFVYAIQAVGTNYIKFGKSRNPDRRLLRISPKMPFETRFVEVWPSNFMSLAEKDLHESFGEFRVNGEWFEIPGHYQHLMFVDNAYLYAADMRYAYGRFFLDKITPTIQEESEFWQWVDGATDGIIYGGSLTEMSVDPCSEIFIALIENLFLEITYRDFRPPEDFTQSLEEVYGYKGSDFLESLDTGGAA